MTLVVIGFVIGGLLYWRGYRRAGVVAALASVVGLVVLSMLLLGSQVEAVSPEATGPCRFVLETFADGTIDVSDISAAPLPCPSGWVDISEWVEIP